MQLIKRKKRSILLLAILPIIFLSLFAQPAFSDCPPLIDTAKEFRVQLRSIVMGYLDDPSASDYSNDEIKDLISFYVDRKDSPTIVDCGSKGTITDAEIRLLLQKSIVFKTECNDAKDNDGDGKTDLTDEGCKDSLDNSETNCGNGICESQESCSTCSMDCGICSLIQVFSIKGSAGGTAASFSESGGASLKGTLTSNAIPVDSSQDEFIVKDETGNAVALVNMGNGNMALRGNVFQSQPSLSPASGDFIVRDSAGNAVSYIDSSGNLYLKGVLTQNGNP